MIPIAATGALAQAAYGNIHFGDAVLVGLPALVGVTLGTQSPAAGSRPRSVSLLFAALLVALAVELVVQ